MTSTRPALLVSVRTADEAVAAIEGGCDLLDIKEPRRGSLGAADPATIATICDAAQRFVDGPRLSVALGDLAEWQDDRTIPQLHAAVTFAKVGLYGARDDVEWPRKWQGLRERFEAVAHRKLDWIAVVYADQSAAAPSAESVIEAAAASGCRGVLVDTFAKDRGRLFDHVTPEAVGTWRTTAAAAGLLFAVAGSLRQDDLPRVATLNPDVIAVRGAVCRQGDRTGELCRDAVAGLKKALSERQSALSSTAVAAALPVADAVCDQASPA